MEESYVKSGFPENPAVSLPESHGSVLASVLFIPNMKRYDRLKQQDIRYVKGDKSHVMLHLTNGRKLSVSTHLGQFMRFLDTRWFVRISRSYLINLLYIEAVTTRSVIVAGQSLPLTEPYKAALWKRLPIVRLKSD